ncbi:MAG: hypothetical protein R3247_01395 [Rhodothermales bacterium]|nr:hypothetical protein [Rhodothermales bacterium]
MSMQRVIKNPSARVVLAALESYGFPRPHVEHRFHPERRWRFDFAWPAYRVALEKEGGLYGRGPRCAACGRRRGGAHSSVAGLKRDLEKYNAAAALAWYVLRQPPDRLLMRSSLKLLRDVLSMRGAQMNPAAKYALG